MLAERTLLVVCPLATLVPPIRRQMVALLLRADQLVPVVSLRVELLRWLDTRLPVPLLPRVAMLVRAATQSAALLVPQRAVPQRAVPQRAVSQRAVSQRAVSEQAVPQQAVPQQVAPHLR
jgi:dolichol-phosphate mannosyltransferase